jgi:hypothetical protein
MQVRMINAAPCPVVLGTWTMFKSNDRLFISPPQNCSRSTLDFLCFIPQLNGQSTHRNLMFLGYNQNPPVDERSKRRNHNEVFRLDQGRIPWLASGLHPHSCAKFAVDHRNSLPSAFHHIIKDHPPIPKYSTLPQSWPRRFARLHTRVAEPSGITSD